MHVRTITNPHATKVAAVLEEMLVRTRAGRVPSLLFIIEEVGDTTPRYGVVGQFRVDPTKALGHLVVMKEKLTDFAADRAPEIEESEED